MATGRTINSKIVANGSNVQRIVAAGSEIYRVVVEGVVRYDRKDYTLTKANYSYSVPITGGSVSLPSTAVTSTYDGYNDSGTRVNGASANYSITPSSFSSRAGVTGNAITGYFKIVQDNSGLVLSGSTNGIPYSQPADSYETTNIITGLSLTLSNAADIPASGGSVNSCDVSVTALGFEKQEWVSGLVTSGSNVSWSLDSTACTYAWTGVTAQSRGTIVSGRTDVGTLHCKATYKANTSIKGEADKTIYQEANSITGYTPWTYALAVSTNVTGNYSSVGGPVDVYYQAQRGRQPVYTSKATGDTQTTNLQNPADLGANVGTMSPNSVNGTGTATLTVPQNTSSNRTITITLSASTDDGTKRATTSFTQYGSSAVYAYAYLSNYTGNGQITSWDDVNDVRKEITNWNSPTTSVYNVTADGVSKYRVGNTPSSNMVQADTYFYKHPDDTLLFYTRNVTTAGAAGTEHLWYKNPDWKFAQNLDGTTIPASQTTIQLTGSTNTKYYYTVKRGTTTVQAKTLWTGGTQTITIGENTSTYSTRSFSITFEEYYSSAGNKPTMSTVSFTQAKKVSGDVSISSNDPDVYTISGNLYWDYLLGGTNPIQISVSSTGASWSASFDSNLLSLSRTTGTAGTTWYVNVTAQNLNQWEEGEPVEIVFTCGNVTKSMYVTYMG